MMSSAGQLTSDRLLENTGLGFQMHQLAARLFPVHRSITGEGTRRTLEILGESIPMAISEVPTGTTVFDWTVPKEWRIRDAFIKNRNGQRLLDYRRSNLHVVNGSNPVNRRMPWKQLKTRVHTLADHPDWIPYRTDFFTDGWGFCMAHRQIQEFEKNGPDAEYDVVIDSDYLDGALTYGEVYLPGRVKREILIWAHICHPSLANDNLSGVVVASQLAEQLEQIDRYYSFRFVFAPATLGAITWLARNQERISRIDHGLILTLLGDTAELRYKKSRQGGAVIDRAGEYLLGEGFLSEVQDFSPFGYDERQFCAPGIDLPVGRFMRSSHGEFAQYHTSADDLSFIRPTQLEQALSVCRRLVRLLERNRTYVNRKPNCEPKLGDYGIYSGYSQTDDPGQLQEAFLWLLNLADGSHDLLSIAERSGTSFELLDRAADLLVENDLIYDPHSSDLLEGK